MDIRDYTEQTFDDAKEIVKARFGDGACFLLRKLLDNPLRSLFPSAGDIAYRDGKPIVFQAAILKRLFLRQTEVLGIVGAMLCKIPKAPLRYVLSVTERTYISRAGSKMMFGNTVMPVSAGISLVSNSTAGPESCENIRFCVIRLGGFLNFVTHGKLPSFMVWLLDGLWLWGTKIFDGSKGMVCVRRIMSLDETAMDDFWKRYLASNKGLVCSRTKKELNWVFGEGIKNGTAHFLVLEKEGQLCGYVVLKRMSEDLSSRWMVVDWIAERDDRELLIELLAGAKRHLQTVQGAAFVEIIGYPMFVQDVIREVFPYHRKAQSNSFTCRIDDASFRQEFNRVKDVSWFFGAYDGDRCFC